MVNGAGIPQTKMREDATTGQYYARVFADAGVRKILRLMGPAIFGVSVAQINMMLDTILASFLQTGSISWLYYADRLLEFPVHLRPVLRQHMP